MSMELLEESGQKGNVLAMEIDVFSINSAATSFLLR